MTDTTDPEAPDSTTPYTWESRQKIALHFSTDAVQSIMRKDDPWALEFDYTRMMMTFLLMQPEPVNILIIGLGGGSLSKFCFRHLPDSHITTLEINPEVIGLRDTFLIPPESERFRIIEADAAIWMAQENPVADVILLDAYTADGMPPELGTDVFIHDCRRALRPGGVLVANLWRRAADFRPILTRLNQAFGRRVLRLGCDTGNEVVFACREPAMPPFQEVWQSALAWQGKTGLNLPQYLENLVFSTHNHWFYNHV